MANDKPKSATEIDAEKDAKPRMDLVSPYFGLSAGRGLGRGASKHGTPGGLGTYRIRGNRQSLVAEHLASLERHLADLKAGKLYVPDTPGYLTHDAISAQWSILCDLFFDPVQEPTGDELRWPWPHLGKDGVRTVEPPMGPPEPVTVGSAFAAGAVEGEDPWKLPTGWFWRRDAEGVCYAGNGSVVVSWDTLPSATYPEVSRLVARRNRFERWSPE